MKNLWKLMLGVIALLSMLLVLWGCSLGAQTHTCIGKTEVIEKEATCHTAGSKKFVCSCGKTVKTEKIPLIAHTEKIVPGKAATCIATGLTEGKECSVCGETLVAQTTILLSEHTEEIVPGKAATCTEKGLTNGKKCSVCGITLAWQTEISPIPHTEETVPGREATCKEIGLTNGKKCSVCGITLASQAEIPIENHTEEIVPGKAATCTEKGLTNGKKCSVCGETLVAQTTIPLASHTYDDAYDATCNVCGFVRNAACRHSSQITVPGYAATCTQTGLTDGKKCSSCGEILVAQTTIPLAPHTEETIPGYAASCTEAGLTDGKKCSVCGEMLVVQTEIPLASHTEETIPGHASTCTVAGMTDGKKCSVCGETLVAQTELPLASHTEETVPGYASTCTVPGLTNGKKCSACGVTLVAQTEIPLQDHNMVDGVCTECYYPYIAIRTVEDLQNVSVNLSGNYILINDLDLGGMEWTPIGTEDNPFTGTFDGNGHVISNFEITRSVEYAGLFGYSKGTIKNLGLESFTVDVSRSGDVYAGGLVGYNYGYNGGDATITNCYATGDVSASSTSTSSSAFAYAGGLVGENDGGTITNCYATGDVSASSTSTSSSAFAYAGGLVGYHYGTITNCYATGDVSASSTSTSRYVYAYAGGLVGETYGSITNSYRYSGQSFTVTQGNTTTYEATNTEGIATSIENLQSKAWVEENLWKVETEIWSFGSGYPTLDYDVIETLVEISTKEDLLKLQDEWIVRTYKLMADIDLGGMEWQPIAMLLGTFDGNGHVISNFKITGEMQYAGLFGYNQGTIQNLGIESFTIDVNCSGYIYAGGLVGYNDYGDITNCYAMGDVSASSNSSAYAGGLVGENYGTITNCYATGDVSASSTSSNRYAYAYAGGLVGYNDYGDITNCYATGDVSASSTSSDSLADAYAGGLVGINGSIIQNSYATGDVSASSRYAFAGGLVGYHYGTITNCYRYSGQSFTVTEGETTTYFATNTEGTAKDMANLQSVDFQQNTLLWSAEDWNFAAGTHPTLKNVGIEN